MYCGCAFINPTASARRWHDIVCLILNYYFFVHERTSSNEHICYLHLPLFLTHEIIKIVENETNYSVRSCENYKSFRCAGHFVTRFQLLNLNRRHKSLKNEEKLFLVLYTEIRVTLYFIRYNS